MYLTTALITLVAVLGISAAPVASSDSEIAARDNYRTPHTTHVVDVGKNGLTYSPPFIFAKPGDHVRLDFYAANHTLVQADVTTPCEPKPWGIFAGFQPTNVTKNNTGLVTFKSVWFEVYTESPLWFYCAQAKHCQAGMLFAINPPSNESVKQFAAVAATKAQNIAPSGGPIGVRAGFVKEFI
jgi:plastocyanin